MAVAIGNGLFRHPAEVDRAHHGAIHRGDHRRIGRDVTENVDLYRPPLRRQRLDMNDCAAVLISQPQAGESS
jgi:hypothetical protein